MRLSDIPVDLTREQAQELARRELADPAYRAARPSLLERAIQWVLDRVSDLASGVSDAAPGGWLGVLGLVLLVVVAVVVVRWRMGPVAHTARLEFTVDPGTSAAQYRARAEELAAAGRWDAAIAQRMRAVVRGCQEQGLIDAQPGWTADEIAREAGGRRPDLAGSLAAAARTFDDVRYGGRPGSAPAYEVVATCDERLRSTGSPR